MQLVSAHRMYRNVRDLWRIIFQNCVVEIGGDRPELQLEAIYAKVLMRRFKPDFVSSGILTFPSLATCSHRIYQAIKSLIDSASKYLSSLPISLHYCLIQNFFISPPHSCNI